MMTALIADDSKGSRDVVRYLIMKQINAVTKEAANGIAALEIIKTMHIDILITDIKMPQMDGIELIERAKQINRDIQVIVFSAFGNFEFAKKVLQFGAINYLLKPINADEFNKTFEAVIKNYEEKQRRTAVQQFDEIIISKTPRTEALPEPLNQYNRLIMLQAESTADCGEAEKMFRAYNDKFVVTPCKNGLFILLQNDAELSPQALTELHAAVSDKYDCYMYYTTFECNERSLHEAYSLTVKRAREDMFWEMPFACCEPEKSAEKQTDADLAPLFEQARCIGKHISQGADGIEEEIEQLISSMRSKKTTSKQCKYIFSELVKVLFSSAVLDIPYDTAIEMITNAEYLSDIKNSIEMIISELSFPQNELSNSNTSPIIKTALEIIHNEYMTEISRTSISERIYISSAYFSQLFKKETGKNFSQYLNEYRMNCACTLLRTTTQNIHSIAKAVGFTNYSYFCSQFKKQYGQTCIQYRESHFKEGD